MRTKKTLHQTLARLRLSVLVSGEKQPGLYWDSKGLSTAGQNDLRSVFPRTSLLAAANHAGELAKSHHDKLTRASGVYHLFRLPVEIETGIHRQMMEEIPNDLNLEEAIWEELAELPSITAELMKGPVDLKSLDLSDKKAISLLGHTYKAAFEASLSCVPYFLIKA